MGSSGLFVFDGFCCSFVCFVSFFLYNLHWYQRWWIPHSCITTVLTENTDLISLSKDQSYQPILTADYLLLCFLLQPYFFSNWSQFFCLSPRTSVGFGDLSIASNSYLLPSSSLAQPPDSVFPSRTPFLVSLHIFTPIFSKILSTKHLHWVVPLSATHWRKSQNPLSTLSSRIWCQSTSDQLQSMCVSMAWLLMLWPWEKDHRRQLLKSIQRTDARKDKNKA